MLGPRASRRLSGPNPIILTNSYLENSENWNLLKIVHICFNLARRFVAPRFRKSWHPWHWQWDLTPKWWYPISSWWLQSWQVSVLERKPTKYMFLVALLWLFVATPSMEGESIVLRSPPQPPSIITPAARLWGHATSLIKILLKLPHTPLHSVPPSGHCTVLYCTVLYSTPSHPGVTV